MVDFGLSWSSMSSLFVLLPQPVLAQVVFGSNPAAFLGIALAIGGASLYFLRNFRPQLARDQDIALAAIALLAGAILFFQGWRLDPILTFGCFLLSGSAAWFAFEMLKLRGATAEQAKRASGPLVDNERPVSRVYRAEIDELAPLDERPVNRRIRGQRDTRSSADVDTYGDDVRRRPSLRGSSDRSSSSSSSSRSKRRSTPRPDDRSAYRPDPNYWDDDASSRPSRSAWDDEPDSYSSARFEDTRAGSRDDYDSRPRRSRSSDDRSRRRPDAEPADYVDFQPVDDYSDQDYGSSGYDRS